MEYKRVMEHRPQGRVRLLDRRGEPTVFKEIDFEADTLKYSERAMGIEPTAFSLARRRSTGELRPRQRLL